MQEERVVILVTWINNIKFHSNLKQIIQYIAMIYIKKFKISSIWEKHHRFFVIINL